MNDLQNKYETKRIVFNFWSKVYICLLWTLGLFSLSPIGLTIYFFGKKVPLRIIDHIVLSVGIVLVLGLLVLWSRDAREKANDDIIELEREINDSVGLT